MFALKEWKLSIFNIVDKHIKFYSHNLLPPKPKSSFRHLKRGIQEFYRKYVLVPADKATNKAYKEISTDEKNVVAIQMI